MFRKCQPACLKLFLLLIAALVALPLSAQVDLSGPWKQGFQEDWTARGDAAIGDYMNLPINDAARMRGDTWNAEMWTVVEHQCHYHPADYGPRGPSQMRIWSDVDPLTQGVVAWHMVLNYMLPHRTIYMDKRPHPPEWAPHTWQGFSTGEWEGDLLKISTTHLKEGYFRRNGVARSEKATLTEFLIRNHDYLTLATVIEDPVYLTEPMVITTDWSSSIGFQLAPNFCIYSQEIERPRGWVAFHLPGQNKWLHEFSEKTGIPYEVMRGGAESMYPEYQKKLATMPIPPPRQAGD
ncbi:MAG TPA: hypothetical protein VG892_00265 [Terriglobales bacterium]|nr:hypothetical protein [Terriglobales bacterium]